MKWFVQLIAFVSLWLSKCRLLIKKHFFLFWCILSWLIFLSVLAVEFVIGYPFIMIIPSALFFVIVFQQFAVPIIRKRLLPIASLSPAPLEKHNEQTRILVVCPVIVTSLQKGRDAIKRLVELRKSNAEPCIDYLLLADFQDALRFSSATDNELIFTLAKETEECSGEASHPIMYIHCSRTGEPKRFARQEEFLKHKAINLILHLIAGKDVLDSFIYSSVEPSFLYNRYKYLITVDTNAIYPCDSILKMASMMEKPFFENNIDKKNYKFNILIPGLKQSSHLKKTVFSRCFSYTRCTNWDFHGFFQSNAMVNVQAFCQAVEKSSIAQDAVLSLPQIYILGGYVFCDDIVLDYAPSQTLESYLSKQFQQIFTISSAFRMIDPWNKFRKILKPTDRLILWSALFALFLPFVQLFVMTCAVITNRSFLFLITLLLPAFRNPSQFSARSFAQMLFALLYLPAEACLYPALLLTRLYQRIMKKPNTISFKPIAPFSDKNPDTTSLIYSIQLLFASLYGVSFIFGNGAGVGLFIGILWALFPVVLPYLERFDK